MGFSVPFHTSLLGHEDSVRLHIMPAAQATSRQAARAQDGGCPAGRVGGVWGRRGVQRNGIDHHLRVPSPPSEIRA